MYLREMGSVELLSREGEIAIAKRIEAGREAMIAGLCESPLTFQAIIIWREELEAGKVLLRDIIDLEATYAGPEGKAAKTAEPAPAADLAPATAPRTPPAGLQEDVPPAEETFEEEDDMENSVSLSAMEAELKPKVLETFARIADAYKKLRRLQDQNVENKLKNETLTPAQERKYKTLKKEIVTDVKSLSLNQNRIEALVEQLYDINKRLIGYETKLLRLADSHGVEREDFIDKFHGSELDPKWVMRVAKLGSQGLEGIRRHGQGPHQGSARRHSCACDRDGTGNLRVPQDRAYGAEGRARSPAGEEGNGRGESASRDLHRQEIHQSRPAIPRPHPGRQHRPDEGGR